MLDKIGRIAKPLIASGPGGVTHKLGRALVGTVHGDLHDIGKNIVSFVLDINGFEVKDIGIDVPVPVFLEEIRSFKPDDQIDEAIKVYTGADVFGVNAVEAVALCKRWRGVAA
jgi:5-methyltetrahydrofolate--homocysteine methyltransferase